MVKNNIVTSEGNIQFQYPDGKIVNVHPQHIYTVFNEDTVSFILVGLPKTSGLSLMASKAEDLLINGSSYTIGELPDVLAEEFAEAGAQARCEVVDVLPSTGKTNTIYLVPKSEGSGFDEYVYLKDENRWELLGDTDIEMSRYLKKTDFNSYSSATDSRISIIETNVSNNASDIVYISGVVDTKLAISDFNIYSGIVDNKLDELDASQTSQDAVIATKLDASAYTPSEFVTSGDVVTSVTKNTLEFYNRSGATLFNIELDNITVDDHLDSGSTNPVQNSAITKVIEDNEFAIVTALNNLNDRKLDASAYTPTDLSDYYIKSEVNAKINEAVSGKVDNTAFAAHTGDSNVHVSTAEKTAWNNKQDAIADLTTIRSNASNGISKATANETALGGLKFVKISQADYDALATKDSDTIYFIQG